MTTHASTTDTTGDHDDHGVHDPHDPARATRSARVLGALAAVSGAALVVDTVTIAVINRSFDPLDSVLFLLGFVTLWATDVALAVHLTHRRSGAARWGVGLGVVVAAALAQLAGSTVFDQLGRHVFSPANRGLHGEWSFFSIGVSQLLLAGWALRRARRA